MNGSLGTTKKLKKPLALILTVVIAASPALSFAEISSGADSPGQVSSDENSDSPQESEGGEGMEPLPGEEGREETPDPDPSSEDGEESGEAGQGSDPEHIDGADGVGIFADVLFINGDGYTEVTDYAEFLAAINEGGEVKILLLNDIYLSRAIEIPDNTYITIKGDAAGGQQVSIIQNIASGNVYTRHFIVPQGTTSSVHLENIQLDAGTKLNSGFHVYADAEFELTGVNSSVTGSTTYGYGGAFRAQNAKVTIDGITFKDNASTTQGGAISLESTEAVLHNIVVEDNHSVRGGGLYITGLAAVTITDSTFRNNSVSSQGGGIFCNASNPASALTFDFINVTVDGNAANLGGGIYFSSVNSTTMNLIDSSVTNNESAGNGGGIYIGTGTINAVRSFIENNTAGGNGGGVMLYDHGFNATNSSVSGNSATEGGGIYSNNFSIVSLKSTDVKDNTADTYGGGIGVYYLYHTLLLQYLRMEDVTFAGNTVKTGNYVSKITDSSLEAHGTWIKDSRRYSSEGSLDFTNAYNNYDITNGSTVRWVKYDANGGVFQGENQETSTVYEDLNRYESGAKGDVTEAPTPYLQGYRLVGWAESAGASVAKYTADDSSFTVTNNTTLYAVWEKATYTVTFDANGIMDVYEASVFASGSGQGATEKYTLEVDAGVIDPALIADLTPSQYGHRFVGWYTEAGGAQAGNEFRYDTADGVWGTEWQFAAGSGGTEVDDNVTLYARWEETEFPVTNENQLHIALSSNRDVIEIELQNDVKLSDAMRADRILSSVTINIWAKDGAPKHITQTGSARHFYLQGGLTVEMNLDNIIANTHSGYGGIEVSKGRLTLTGGTAANDITSQITGITRYPMGGAVYVHGDGKLDMSYMLISGNEASQYGGGIYITDTEATLTGNSFANNSAAYGGGAIAIRATSTVEIEGGVISGNNARIGGGIFTSKLSLAGSSIKSVNFADNKADTYITVLAQEDIDLVTPILSNISGLSGNSVLDLEEDVQFDNGHVLEQYNNYDIGHTGEIFSVTYDLNKAKDGVQIAPVDTNRYGQGSTVQKVTYLDPADAPYLENYEFIGWSEDPDAEFAQGTQPETQFIITKDTTLYAFHRREIVTVTFDAGAGASFNSDSQQEKTVDMNKGDAIATGEIPDAGDMDHTGGKHFQYWHIGDLEKTHYDFSQPVTEDITLHAEWDDIPAAQHMIVFHTNGGSYVEASLFDSDRLGAETWAALGVPGAEDMLRLGYVFDGWFTDAVLSSAIQVNDLSDAAEFNAESRVLDLYAGWQLDDFGVTLETENGSIKWKLNNGAEKVYDPTKEDSEGIDSALTYEDELELEAVPHEGYQFSEWTLNYDDTFAVTPKSKNISLAELFMNIEAKAAFSPIYHTVTFYDEHQDVLTEERARYGSRVNALDVPDPGTEEKVLSHWAVGSSGGSPLGTGTFEIKSDVDLYAVMKARELSVTFDFADENVASESVTVEYNNSVTAPDTAGLDLRYRVLENWKVGNTSNIWNFNDSVVQDMTLKASWKSKAIPAPTAVIEDGQGNPITVQFYEGKHEGQTVTVTAGIEDPNKEDGRLTYQWYLRTGSGRTPVEGAVEETLPIPALSAGTYHYVCEVTYVNDNYSPGRSSVVSNAAEVIVTVEEIIDAKPPVITARPQSETVHQFDPPVELRVAADYYGGNADGNNRLSYQWFKKDGSKLDGEDSDTLIVSTDELGTFEFYVLVTNTNTTVNGQQTASTSADAYVAVIPVEAYAVNYHGNGSTGGSVPSDPTAYRDNEIVVVRTNEGNLTRSGYTFQGWQLGQDDTDILYTGGEQVRIHADLDFYAVWSKKPKKPGGGGGNTEEPEDPKDPDEQKEEDFGPGEEVQDYLELETEEHIVYLHGYTDGTVRPDVNITRAEVAGIFYLLVAEDNKEEPVQSAVFADINATDWYYQQVAYLEKYHVLTGYLDGNFGPGDSITRAEFVTIASRFGSLREGQLNFDDLNSGHWAEAYIANVYSRGWITGYEDGTFRPDEFITRAEAVTVINNMLNRKVEAGDVPEGTNQFIDLPESHWAYTQILEASTEHSYSRKSNGYEIWE